MLSLLQCTAFWSKGKRVKELGSGRVFSVISHYISSSFSPVKVFPLHFLPRAQFHVPFRNVDFLKSIRKRGKKYTFYCKSVQGKKCRCSSPHILEVILCLLLYADNSHQYRDKLQAPQKKCTYACRSIQWMKCLQVDWGPFFKEGNWFHSLRISISAITIPNMGACCNSMERVRDWLDVTCYYRETIRD